MTGPYAAQMSIKDLAREAGWSGLYREWQSATECTWLTVPVTPEQIERFVALVRAVALEEAALVCDVTPSYPFRPSIEAAHAIRALAAKARADLHVV